MSVVVSRDGGVLGAAVLLTLGGVLAVGAAWLARRRCLPSELGGAAAGDVKLQAGEPAAAGAQLELAVAGGGGGADCCPAAAACTSSTASGGAADRLQFERGWAMKYATRKQTAPEKYTQMD